MDALMRREDLEQRNTAPHSSSAKERKPLQNGSRAPCLKSQRPTVDRNVGTWLNVCLNLSATRIQNGSARLQSLHSSQTAGQHCRMYLLYSSPLPSFECFAVCDGPMRGVCTVLAIVRCAAPLRRVQTISEICLVRSQPCCCSRGSSVYDLVVQHSRVEWPRLAVTFLPHRSEDTTAAVGFHIVHLSI